MGRLKKADTYSELSKAVGIVVREMRISLNMAQLDLAREVHLTNRGSNGATTISRYENGLTPIPWYNLERIAKVFGVPVWVIIQRAEKLMQKKDEVSLA